MPFTIVIAVAGTNKALWCCRCDVYCYFPVVVTVVVVVIVLVEPVAVPVVVVLVVVAVAGGVVAAAVAESNLPSLLLLSFGRVLVRGSLEGG